MQEQSKSIRRTSDEMYPLMAEYESSELTQSEFCIENGLSVPVLNYWLRKYREVWSIEAQSEPDEDTGFVRLEIENEPVSTDTGDQRIIIRIPSGVEIKIPIR